MKTITITKADLNENNEYQGDVSNVISHIEIEANLGWVKFKSILTTGRIRSQAV